MPTSDEPSSKRSRIQPASFREEVPVDVTATVMVDVTTVPEHERYDFAVGLVQGEMDLLRARCSPVTIH
jgi:hypothetical protein